VRAGGEILHVCPRSMTVRAPLRRWQEWTGLDFSGAGSHVVPGALVPITVEGEAEGVYAEPGIWVLHRLR
jgi:hypothetical protein